MQACVLSSNGFTQRLELNVRHPALPRLVDGLIGGLALCVLVAAVGPVSWWPALIGLPVWTCISWRGVADARRRGPACVVLTAEGRWRIRCRDREPEPVRLRAGWLAGPFCGLLLVGGNGRRRRVYLCASGLGPDTWRRLRVRLRLPPPASLT